MQRRRDSPDKSGDEPPSVASSNELLTLHVRAKSARSTDGARNNVQRRVTPLTRCHRWCSALVAQRGSHRVRLPRKREGTGAERDAARSPVTRAADSPSVVDRPWSIPSSRKAKSRHERELRPATEGPRRHLLAERAGTALLREALAPRRRARSALVSGRRIRCRASRTLWRN